MVQAEDSARDLVHVTPSQENRASVEHVLSRQYTIVELLKHILHYLVMSFTRDYSFVIKYANAQSRDELSQADKDTLRSLEKGE